MALTVGELVEMPHLMLRVHAGACGLDREIAWAHTSDLPEPWRWVGPGDLLMTNGINFPADSAGQVDLLRRLRDREVSGLAIGEDMYCPPLAAEVAAEADRLRLPVLWIRYPLPFVSISRTVATATLPEQADRVLRTSRIYDAIRRTTGVSTDRSHTTRAIGQVLDCMVYVCDQRTGDSHFPADGCPPVDVREAVRRVDPESAGAFDRMVRTADHGAMFVVPVPTHRRCVLVAVPNASATPDPHLLQHAATVVALELSHVHMEIEHRRRLGSELAAHLLDGRGDADAASRDLRQHGIDVSSALLVAASADDAGLVFDLHMALWSRGIAHVLVVRTGIAHVILPATADWAATLTDALGDASRVGVSRPLGEVARVPEAGREAMWALGMARSGGPRVVRYGDASPAIGPRTVADARALVEHVLGPVLRYDAVHDSNLATTLDVFLHRRRSWAETARDLQVHRETVRYRIKKVEELTGSDLAESADVTRMWLALEARRTTEALPPG